MKDKILALDVGEKFIGIAITISKGISMTPLPPLQRKEGSLRLNAIKSLVKEHGIEEIVIGLPLNMDGTKGKAYRKIKGYAFKVSKQLKDLNIAYQDERLSTWSVKNKFKRLKLDKNNSEKNIDSFAAMEILNDYLQISRDEI